MWINVDLLIVKILSIYEKKYEIIICLLTKNISNELDNIIIPSVWGHSSHQNTPKNSKILTQNTADPLLKRDYGAHNA